MRSSAIHLIVWICISAAAVVGHGLWYSVIAKKSAGVANLQSQIDAKTETANRVALARTALAEIADNESAVQNYFVSEAGVVLFIDHLESRAREQAVALQVLSVSAGDSAPRPTLIFLITVRGTFDAVLRTVGAIEYAPYSISLSKLSLVSEGKNLWGANLELVVGSVPEGTTSTKETERKVISFNHP